MERVELLVRVAERGGPVHHEDAPCLDEREQVRRVEIVRVDGRVGAHPDRVEVGGEMILKPPHGWGGLGIFHVHAGDRNLNAIIETVTEGGRTLTMAQQYIKAVRELGDERVIMLDGEPLGAIARVPREDEHRSNLHVGGTARKVELGARERRICDRVGPALRAAGLYFVGLDIIGDYLTEVNVTSPTGIQEIDRLDGVCLETKVIELVERKAAECTSRRKN